MRIRGRSIANLPRAIRRALSRRIRPWRTIRSQKSLQQSNKMDKIPHFLIVGAPKCGTTSLYRYLQQHPKIFMPENKEPRFFCNYPVKTFEFGIKQFHPGIVSTPDDYQALFHPAPSRALCGEASTDYLAAPGTAHRIHDWNPLAKIIIMLRDPVDRAYSEYCHSIAAHLQAQSFWESLSLENVRIAERYDPIFWHVRRGLYFRAVKDYVDIFGRNNVMIIFYEDFSRSTASVVDAVFRFLGVSAIAARMPKQHAAQAADARRAQDVLSREQYEKLKGNFANDIVNLQSFLGVNLTRWL